MDVDPRGGIVGFGIGMAEHRLGDLRLARRLGARAASGQEIEQIAQAAGTADQTAFADPLDLLRKTGLRLVHMPKVRCNVLLRGITVINLDWRERLVTLDPDMNCWIGSRF